MTLEHYSPGGPEKKGFKIVNFGPLYILTSLGGPTPDLTREHYSSGGPEKNGFEIVNFGPLCVFDSAYLGRQSS